MRDKIIKRFAAGTIGVCFAYALLRQPFAVMKDPGELITPNGSVATQSATQPATVYPVTTVPPTLPEELQEEIEETDPLQDNVFEQPETEAFTEPLQEVNQILVDFIRILQVGSVGCVMIESVLQDFFLTILDLGGLLPDTFLTILIHLDIPFIDVGGVVDDQLNF